MLEPTRKLAFIRQIHLFNGCSEEELSIIAEALAERTCEEGEIISRQGQMGDRFHLIYSGKVTVNRRRRSKPPLVTELVAGDYFGPDALLKEGRRTATLTAKEGTTLLSLARADYLALVKRIPRLHSKFGLAIASHRLVSKTHFSWLEPDEVVYFIAQEHVIMLVQSLIIPILGLLIPIIFLILYLLDPGTGFYLWIAGLSLVGIGIWIFLRWLDWSNDYYIVTNRRVVNVQKVILLYDSRQEANLTAILSVNTQSEFIGRVLGIGDVIIRTYVGNIVFKNVGFPEEVQALLRAYWDRTKKISRQANVEAMKQSIRQKLGLETPVPVKEPPKPAIKHKRDFTLLKLRYEEKGVITYRKHWLVLLKQTFLPGIFALSVLIYMLWALFNIRTLGYGASTFLTVFFFGFVPLMLWWVYQVIDWSNDQFLIADDQILDIDRTPLGREKKNVAPLDNILNMEARRDGIFQILFNYGNVYITVGSSQMVFEDVMSPNDVQKDIDQRRMARRDKLEQDKNAADRERLSEFFAAYHQNASTLRAEMEAKDRNQQSNSPPGGDPAGEEN